MTVFMPIGSVAVMYTVWRKILNFIKLSMVGSWMIQVVIFTNFIKKARFQSNDFRRETVLRVSKFIVKKLSEFFTL